MTSTDVRKGAICASPKGDPESLQHKNVECDGRFIQVLTDYPPISEYVCLKCREWYSYGDFGNGEHEFHYWGEMMGTWLDNLAAHQEFIKPCRSTYSGHMWVYQGERKRNCWRCGLLNLRRYKWQK